MILDSSKLTMIGLGSRGTVPSPDGVHLRWSFDKSLGFPSDPFQVYRRKAIAEEWICARLSRYLSNGAPEKGFQINKFLIAYRSTPITIGTQKDTYAIGFKKRGEIKVQLPGCARKVRIQFVGMSRRGILEVHAHAGDRRIFSRKYPVSDGFQTEEIDVYGIDSVTLILSEAALADVCYLPCHEEVSLDDLKRGWQYLGGKGLPTSPTYALKNTYAPRKESTRLRRAFNTWLKDAIDILTAAGPTPQFQRTIQYMEGVAGPVPVGTVPPPDTEIFAMNAFSLLMLGSLDPYFARFIGLGWVDRTPIIGERYDYLVRGQWNGTDYYFICYNLAEEPAPALSVITGLNATIFPAPPTIDNPVGCGVGLTWVAPNVQGTGLSYDPVWFDLKGKRAASANNIVPPPPSTFTSTLLNKNGRIVVSRTLDSNGNPQLPTYFFSHKPSQDGWYAYTVQGIDLFGRQTPWSTEATARVLDIAPPPAPRLLEVVSGVTTEHFPLQARFVDSNDPQTKTSDRALLTSAGVSTGLVVEWTWFAENQALAPDTREFRIYTHPSFTGFQSTITSILSANASTSVVRLSTVPPFNSVGGQLVHQGTSYHILAVTGTDLTVRNSVRPEADGSSTMIQPAPGPCTVLEELTNPRKWSRRIFVQPIDTANPSKTYRVFIPNFSLPTSIVAPLTTAWIGVTAVDRRSYIPDDPARTGPLSGRYGNESEIAVRARAFAVNRQTPAPGPLPAGPVYATRADFYGRSRYRLTWSSVPHAKYHVWRTTESAVCASDLKARQLRTAGTHYASGSSFVDDPGFAAWLSATFPGVSESSLITNPNSATSKPVWTAWAARFYSASNLTDSLLRTLADRAPNHRTFSQVTTEPLTAPTLEDEFDGRVTGRYLYKTQIVYPNLTTGPLGPASVPVHLYDVVPPQAPIIERATTGDRSLTVYWARNPEPDLDHYEVFLDDASPTAPADPRLMTLVSGAVAATDQSLTIPGLKGCHEYRVVVMAVDTQGNRSEPSKPKSARTVALTPLPKPTLTAVRELPSEVSVKWTLPENGIKTFVERSEDGGLTWRALATWLPANTNSLSDSAALAPAYQYRIKWLDHGGNQTVFSDPSPTV